MMNSSTHDSAKKNNREIEARLASILSYYPDELEKFLDSIKLRKVNISNKTMRTIMDFASSYCCLKTTSIDHTEFIVN